MEVVNALSLEVEVGEFVTLLGTSGCGKSTILNAIAGFVEVDCGKIKSNGKAVLGPGPDRAMVFQNHALYSWKTAVENIEFGIRSSKLFSSQSLNDLRNFVSDALSRLSDYIPFESNRSLLPSQLARLSRLLPIPKRSREIRDSAMALVSQVGLEGFENHYPHELSGGMCQRVGIARALAVSPEILLLDEPFGALDAQTRLEMQELLLKLWAESKKTVLFVTHDIDEAILLSDRVFVLTARPAKILETISINFERPRTYDLLGEPEFAKIKSHILKLLRTESQKKPGSDHAN